MHAVSRIAEDCGARACHDLRARVQDVQEAYCEAEAEMELAWPAKATMEARLAGVEAEAAAAVRRANCERDALMLAQGRAEHGANALRQESPQGRGILRHVELACLELRTTEATLCDRLRRSEAHASREAERRPKFCPSVGGRAERERERG